jgi:4-hydroxy 2-oxovalerate aldolase
MQKSIKILDCTLRDGGYYNNWDFSPTIIENYLSAVAEANIDFVELGLRNFAKPGFLGAFAYTTEDFINQMELPEGPSYGVMVDAKTILSSEFSIKAAIDTLFVPANDSKISLVRVAAHFAEVEKCGPIVKYLKELGYLVGLNLMQAGGKSSNAIADKARQVKKWNAVDTLYFADSLGNMDSAEVNRIIDVLREHWDGELGIHTHNNMGAALNNTLIAKQGGVTWLDSTITGMGRGAGNAQTECLLAKIHSPELNYNPKPIYELVIRDFEPMQKQYGWGSSLLYFLGAQNDVHPTYIQNLLSEKSYGQSEVVGIIDYLSQLEGTIAYNGDVFNSAISFAHSTKAVSGSNVLVNKFKNREVLILANGPSLVRYQKDIEAYIKKINPIVIAINTLSDFDNQYVDFYCVSHNSKLLSERMLYNKLTKPIILPLHLFSDEEMKTLDGSNAIIDYGLNVESGKFEILSTYTTIPNETTVAYALSIAHISGSNKISLIGFDGYESNDHRQLEMIEMFNLFNTLPGHAPLLALTPTTYPVEQSSIYAPIKERALPNGE